MTSSIRVGIIGASSAGGWARESHVPAVRQLRGFELVAVATSNPQTAEESAKAFGVSKAYGSGHDLIQDPDIDLVAITTRVSDHRKLVLDAIGAKKHIYCEWPLGVSVSEAKQMAEAAKKAGLHVAIGLQQRGSPAVRHARHLIESGAIGRLLSINSYAATAGFGPTVPAPLMYTEDPSTFANLVTIQGAHAVDLSIVLGGELQHFNAMTTRQYPVVTAMQTGRTQPRTTFDHLLVVGVLKNQATIAVEVAGGRPPRTPFRLDVTGEKGTLALKGGAARGAQSSRLTLWVNDEAENVEEGELSQLPETAVNVAGIYGALRDDIQSNQHTVADFATAVELTQLTEDIFESSRTGNRQSAIRSGD